MASAIYPLALAYAEYLGTADGTHPLGSWPSILEGDRLWVLHLPFGPALHAVRFHTNAPFGGFVTWQTSGRQHPCQCRPTVEHATVSASANRGRMTQAVNLSDGHKQQIARAVCRSTYADNDLGQPLFNLIL